MKPVQLFILSGSFALYGCGVARRYLRRFCIGSVLWPALLWPAAAPATPFSDLTLVYDATFDDGTLNPSVDSIGIGPLQLGDTLIPGSNPTGVLENGGLTLSITHPSGAVDVGAVATPDSFGQGSILGLRAVYASPLGPHGASDTWAVGLVARTDFVDDLATSLRAAATLQVIGGSARLNTPGASTPANFPIPQSIYNLIFLPGDTGAPATFTLEMVVDRIAGTGFASFSSGDFTVSRDYTFSVFGADFGPDITALEPTIAITRGDDTTASVRVLDFQIFTERVPEPPTWMLFGSVLIAAAAIKTLVDLSIAQAGHTIVDHKP